MKYEDDIRIDATALDVEWLEQPSLAMKYGRIYAGIKADLAKAEEKVKVIRSELIKEANENPEMCCGKSKPNASDIEAYYRNDERHKKIKKKILKLQHECDIAEIAKNEVSFTRKAALENLVTLHGAQYFAGPAIPRNITKEWEDKERSKRTSRKITEGMRRTR